MLTYLKLNKGSKTYAGALTTNNTLAYALINTEELYDGVKTTTVGEITVNDNGKNTSFYAKSDEVDFSEIPIAARMKLDGELRSTSEQNFANE